MMKCDRNWGHKTELASYFVSHRHIYWKERTLTFDISVDAVMQKILKRNNLNV